MQSTMQMGDLGVARILRHAWRFGASRPVHYRDGTATATTDMHHTAGRAARLGAALAGLGLGPGDRVATFCAATLTHLEAYLAVPSHGMVLHALNIRMGDADLARMIHDHGDRVLILDHDLAARFATLAPLLADSTLELVVVAGAGGAALPAFPGLDLPIRCHEDLLASVPVPDVLALPDPAETSAAAICHTGGTTGRPKAVAYSHRAVWLQALSLCLADGLAIGRDDVALLAVPFYHVNGWGLPYAAAMSGAGLALPGGSFRAEILHGMMQDCDVTIAAGVPTIWTDLLGHLDGAGVDLPAPLMRIATGGSMVPAALIEGLSRRGVGVLQAWGMTETASMSVIGAPGDATSGPAPVGHPWPGLELRVVDTTGQAIAPGETVTGEVQVRGACVIDGYLGATEAATDPDGWFATGDIGRIASDGALVLTDRLKDAVKSGGEWIPAPLLEDAIRNVPGIADAAIIACPHERFQERPFAVVVLRPGAVFDRDGAENRLRAAVPGWWLPEGWAVLDALPRTTLGKPDKIALRALLAAGAFDDQTGPRPEPATPVS
ncbi:AMP-binding protein [Pseudooceanicola aestuarii]|uniref:AMP-binding protein n=1 Tax=Pseudooceanicola aestuarii TaxID=2697319 RepID=UPI0013D81142|nr:AMP-binding protein [Pseudooceanicola aestuarii]